MALGDIVALALGGYLFLTLFQPTGDRLERLDGYQALFACGVAGAVLLGATAPLAFLLQRVSGWAWLNSIPVQSVAAALGIPLAAVVATLLNRSRHTTAWRRRLLRRSAELNADLTEVLFDDAIQGAWFVELTLATGKSYVGMPTRTVYVAASEGADVELIPLFSGYRTPKTHELRLTRYYGDDIAALTRSHGSGQRALVPRDFRVVVPLREVVTARLFDPEVFVVLNA